MSLERRNFWKSISSVLPELRWSEQNSSAAGYLASSCQSLGEE
jgi:hypothetical protein